MSPIPIEAARTAKFVYAFHDDQYADEIGRLLIDTVPPPQVIALESASIDAGTTSDEIERSLAMITDSNSFPESVEHGLNSLGPFWGPLLRRLVGSNIEVRLIDAFDDARLSNQSARISYVEQPRRLSRVVSDPQMSLERRQQDIGSLAKEVSLITKMRDEVVLGQLRELGSRTRRLAIFQGMAHQAVAATLEKEGWQVSQSFVPRLNVWETQEDPLENPNIPTFLKLVEAVNSDGSDAESIGELVNKALLSEFVVAYISHNHKRALEVSNVYGAMIAATRIVDSLIPDRVNQKVKAAVKASRGKGSMAKVIEPLLPKHSMNVFEF